MDDEVLDKILMDQGMDNVLMDGRVEKKRSLGGRRGVYILLDDGCLEINFPKNDKNVLRIER